MLLKKGSSGEDVKRLQKFLGLTQDGVFGPGTELKVKAWQSANGLASDGIIGDITWNKLEELNNKVIKPVTESKSSILSLDKLKGHIPDGVLAQIPDTSVKFNINSNLRLAHFLSQCAHESGNFKWVVEFASGKAYEGREDLGNTQPGDGVKFKGRGFIQLTGRANYNTFSKFVNEDCVINPELVATKYPMMSAAYFFDKNNLWKTCDIGSTDEVVKKVTRRVNGGTNGLDDRLKKFHHFWSLLK